MIKNSALLHFRTPFSLGLGLCLVLSRVSSCAIFGFWDLDTNEHLILPLTTYFQNVHLQCKNKKLLEYKSSTYIHKGYQKEIM